MDAQSSQAFTLLRPHFVVIDEVAHVPTEAAALVLGRSVKTFRRHAEIHGVEPVTYRRLLLWRVEEVLMLARKPPHP